MAPSPSPDDVYSAREIAAAAGVPERLVVAALGGVARYVPFAEAVRMGRALARGADGPLFSMFAPAGSTSWPAVPLVVSSALHAGVLGVAVYIALLGAGPQAASLTRAEAAEPMRLVFLATPGPGGGGGGGGLQQKIAPPKALREGRHAVSSPLPERVPPKRVEPAPRPPEPPPPLAAESLPVVVAPIITAPADIRSRPGVLEQTTVDVDSRGSGRGGGVGSGTGTGIGAGDGSGIGPGSGGGTGGGPYRPGSGIRPPRLLKEVKADYTEDARQRSISGEVVLEIVVRRDGTVGDVKILQGLGGGLNDRAAQAVRQWRFSPAERQGTPVDVLVEVAVEFKLR